MILARTWKFLTWNEIEWRQRVGAQIPEFFFFLFSSDLWISHELSPFLFFIFQPSTLLFSFFILLICLSVLIKEIIFFLFFWCNALRNTHKNFFVILFIFFYFPATMVYNILLLVGCCCGFISSLLLIYGLIKVSCFGVILFPFFDCFIKLHVPDYNLCYQTPWFFSWSTFHDSVTRNFSRPLLAMILIPILMIPTDDLLNLIIVN